MPTKEQDKGAVPNSLERGEGCVLLTPQTLVLGAHLGSGESVLLCPLPCSLGTREGLRDQPLFSGKTEMWEVSHLGVFCRAPDLVHTANRIRLMAGTGAGFSAPVFPEFPECLQLAALSQVNPSFLLFHSQSNPKLSLPTKDITIIGKC